VRYTVSLILGTLAASGCKGPTEPTTAPGAAPSVLTIDTTATPSLKPLPVLGPPLTGTDTLPRLLESPTQGMVRKTVHIDGGVFRGDPETIDAIDGAYVNRLDLLSACPDGTTVEGWFRNGTLVAARAPINGRPFVVGLFRGSVSGWFDFEGMGMDGVFRSRPVAGSRITSRYGLRFHPVDKRESKHQGTDYGAPTGTPIHVTATGRISTLANDAGAGLHIVVDHASGQTRYFHMSATAQGVKKGAVVQAGDVIGFVGTTGKSTGPHLHYELRYAGLAIDAAARIPRGQTALGPSERSVHQKTLTKILEIR
jgi:hypothetical protein